MTSPRSSASTAVPDDPRRGPLDRLPGGRQCRLGLLPGGELKVEMTILPGGPARPQGGGHQPCRRGPGLLRPPDAEDTASESCISVPIFTADGRFFGTLSRPAPGDADLARGRRHVSPGRRAHRLPPRRARLLSRITPPVLVRAPRAPATRCPAGRSHPASRRIHRRVGEVARLREARRPRGRAQHPPAGRQQPPVVRPRAGMEDLDPGVRRASPPPDRLAPGVVARDSPRAAITTVSAWSSAKFDPRVSEPRRWRSRHTSSSCAPSRIASAWHLRVAEAHVVLDQLRRRRPSIISPAKSTPWNGVPRRAISASVGRMIRAIAALRSPPP